MEGGTHDPTYYGLLAIIAGGLFALSLGIEIAGLSLLWRMRMHPGWAQLDGKRRRAALVRLHSVMLISVACFFMRLVGISALFFVQSHSGTLLDVLMSNKMLIPWQICTEFIPTVVPMLCFLLLMRKPRAGKLPPTIKTGLGSGSKLLASMHNR